MVGQSVDGHVILTARKSTSRMRKCRDMESTMAPSDHLFAQGGITVSDWFSEMLRKKRTSQYDIWWRRCG